MEKFLNQTNLFPNTYLPALDLDLISRSINELKEKYDPYKSKDNLNIVKPFTFSTPPKISVHASNPFMSTNSGKIQHLDSNIYKNQEKQNNTHEFLPSSSSFSNTNDNPNLDTEKPFKTHLDRNIDKNFESLALQGRKFRRMRKRRT